MKKTISTIISITLILGLLLCLAACGGGNEKKQEAIDAFNSTSKTFNEVATLINENRDAVDDEIISSCQEMSKLLTQYNEILSSDDELSDEQYDEMIDWFATVDDWSVEIKAAIEDSLA